MKRGVADPTSQVASLPGSQIASPAARPGGTSNGELATYRRILSMIQTGYSRCES
jgi:hypothetical protein